MKTAVQITKNSREAKMFIIFNFKWVLHSRESASKPDKLSK